MRQFLQQAGLLTSSPGEVARLRTVEGPRGYSTRATVYVRYAAYLLTIVLCSALSQVLMAASNTTRLAGGATFGASTIMLVVAAVGTGLYPTHRQTIIEQMRHYLFGLMLFPATGLTAISWGITTLGMSPSTSPDVMLRSLNGFIPIIWGATLVIPLVIFIKLVAGVHTMHRSQLDDEEMVALMTRMDSHQR